MSVCAEVRLPPAVRAQRALRLAAEELGVADLEAVLNLASEICKMRVYHDFALEFFEGESMDFELRTVGSSFLVRRRPMGAVSGI